MRALLQIRPAPCYHSLLTPLLPLVLMFVGVSFAPFGPVAVSVAGNAANDIAWT